jgi:hypothetical protein
MANLALAWRRFGVAADYKRFPGISANQTAVIPPEEPGS